MAPYRKGSVQVDCNTILSGEANGFWKKLATVFPFFYLLPIQYAIGNWFGNGKRTVTKTTTKKPIQEKPYEIIPNYVVEPEFQISAKENPVEIVDDEEVEKFYQWVSTTLKVENHGEIKYRYRNLAVELISLANSRSSAFLKALVERVFPTASESQSLLKEQTNAAENIKDTLETEKVTYSVKKQSDGISREKKRFVSSVKIKLKPHNELERIKSSQKEAVKNAIPENEQVLMSMPTYLANTVYSGKNGFRRVPDDGKNGSGAKHHGDAGNKSGKNEASKPGSQRKVSGFDKMFKNICGNGGSDGEGNNPHKQDTSLLSGHYQEVPVPVLGKNADQKKDMMDHDAGTRKSNTRNSEISIDHSSWANHDNMAGGNASDGFSSHGSTHDELMSVGGSNAASSTVHRHVPGLFFSEHLVNAHSSQPEVAVHQSILSPLNKDILSVADSGTYVEVRDFVRIGKIGNGAYGECDLCEDITKGNYFVRKRVKKRLFDINEINTWIKACGCSPARISRNIVEFYGATIDEEYVTMFMEHMSGTLADIADLRDTLALSEREVVALIKPVLQGVDRIHEKEMVHGDIKCQNLLYDENSFDVKICDFGLCIPLSGESFIRKNVPVGTAQCMPPEVCRSEPYGRSSDIWGCGCATFHLLTGQMPWSNYSRREQIILQVGRGRSPEIPPCSPYMKEMLEMMFCVDSAERPTARELLRLPIFADEPGSTLDEVLQNLFFRILEYKYSLANSPSQSSELDAPAAENLAEGGCSPDSLSGLYDVHTFDDGQSGDTAGHLDEEGNQGLTRWATKNGFQHSDELQETFLPPKTEEQTGLE